MSHTHTFINIFNTLEEHMRQKLGKNDQNISHAKLLGMMADKYPLFRDNLSRLHAYRSLRNALVHIPSNGLEQEPIAEPHENILAHYQSLVDYLIKPPSALDSIAVKDVYTITWQTSVADTLQKMLTNSYRLVPIVVENKLVGMFDIGDLSRAVHESFSQDVPFTIHPLSTFEHFYTISSFNNHDPQNIQQSVVGTHFASRKSTTEDIETIFQTNFSKGIMVSVVCITETGCAFEPLLGIVTAHDLPSANGVNLFNTNTETP